MDTFELDEQASKILGAMVHEWGSHLSVRNAFGVKVSTHLRFRKTGSRFIKPKRSSSQTMFDRLRNIRELAEADAEIASKTFEGVLKSFKILTEKLPEMGLDGDKHLRLQQFANRWEINERLVKEHINRVKELGREVYYMDCTGVWGETYKTRYAVTRVLHNFCSRASCILQQLMRALKNKHRHCARLLVRAKSAHNELVELDDFLELSKIVPVLKGHKRSIFASITVQEAESILALNAYLKKRKAHLTMRGKI